jgi:DNA-binding response OmpR family regulator
MGEKWSLVKLFARKRDQAPSLPAGEFIAVGDFKINISERTASLRDQPLHLTPEEFDVLLFLADHRQGLVTPHTVLATNSTGDRHRRADFLRTLMSLRRKLDAVSTGNRHLHTEPWVVYRFDPNRSFPMWDEKPAVPAGVARTSL